MHQIATEMIEDKPEQLRLRTRVKDRSSETSHDVTLARADYVRLAKSNEKAEDFITRCFEFLLERESKESIMSRFDISIISRYFPEFEREIKKA